MFKLINHFEIEISNCNLTETLIQIGEQAGEISFNNRDFDCIRNKYGSMQRVKLENNLKILKGDLSEKTQMKENETRIDFQKLYHLKHTLTRLSDFEKDFILSNSDVKEGLIEDLFNLKFKIAHILLQESESSITYLEFENQIKLLGRGYNPNEHKILNIIKLSSNLYQQLVLKKIYDELYSYDSVSLTSREDLYYFGRKFTIIGELFHELIADETFENIYGMHSRI